MSDSHSYSLQPWSSSPDSYSLQPWSSSPDPPRKPKPKAENPESPTPTPAYPSTLPIPPGSPSTQALLKTPEIPRRVPTPPTMPRRVVFSQSDVSPLPSYTAYCESARRLLESQNDPDFYEDQDDGTTVMPIFAVPMATEAGLDGRSSVGFGSNPFSKIERLTTITKPTQNGHGSASVSAPPGLEADTLEGDKEAKHSAGAWPSRQSLPR